jgi:hypothetical protein
MISPGTKTTPTSTKNTAIAPDAAGSDATPKPDLKSYLESTSG